MRFRFLATLALATVSTPVGAQTQEGLAKRLEDFEKRFPPVKKNAAAEELEHLLLPLGIDPRPRDSSADHPTKEDQDAYRQAGLGAWLDAQVRISDDSISQPPALLQGFLDHRQAGLRLVVGLLEKEVPEWGFDVHESPKELPHLAPVIGAGRILLSAALVEERAGRHAEAEELLEASWSLYRSVSSVPDLSAQLIAFAIGSRQAGVLRKMSDPGFAWPNRMSADAPLARTIDQLRVDPLLIRVRTGPASQDNGFTDLHQRTWNAFADAVERVSPCELSKLSYPEIWQSVKLQPESQESAEQMRTITDIAIPNLMNVLQRAAHLAIDRELTAKILELRQERAALRRGRWPEKFFDVNSRVCPGASYEYQPRGTSMSIRFKGSIEEPAAPALVLPLSFEARAPRPTPTPTPVRTPKAATSRAPRS